MARRTTPSFRASAQSMRDADYVGGFDAQLQYAIARLSASRATRARYGGAFKKRVRDLQPALMQMGGFAKVLARRENRVTVDPARTGPARHSHSRSSNSRRCDNDRALWTDMTRDARGDLPRHRHRAADQGRAACRLREPRSRHVPHGRGPGGLRPQPVLPISRHPQPLRRRRQPVRDVSGEEPDAHDHGARRARHRYITEARRKGEM